MNFSLTDEYANINPETLSKEERRAYTCVKTFGFRKGTKDFNNCIFKIYQAELDLQKLDTEKKLAEAELRIAEANAKAASIERQAANAKQELILKQQLANTQRQAAAARAQARASEMQNALQMMQQGLQSLQPRSSPRMQTCTYGGGLINCF